MFSIKALEKLEDNIRSGRPVVEPRGVFPKNEDWTAAEKAARGNIAAARQLHESFLPKWGWNVEHDGTVSIWGPPIETEEKFVPNIQLTENKNEPALSWLLVIVCALKEEMKNEFF